MESPDCWSETCSDCDGTGVVAVERRENTAVREAIDASTDKVRAEIVALLRERDRIDAVLEEQLEEAHRTIAGLRTIVQQQARLLAVAEPARDLCPNALTGATPGA